MMQDHIWLPQSWTQPAGSSWVHGTVGNRAFLSQAEAQFHCGVGCQPIKIQLPQGYQLIDSDRPNEDDSQDSAWALPEELKRLNITAPPNWNEYNDYLLAGGELEYEEWHAQQVDPTIKTISVTISGESQGEPCQRFFVKPIAGREKVCSGSMHIKGSHPMVDWAAAIASPENGWIELESAVEYLTWSVRRNDDGQEYREMLTLED